MSVSMASLSTCLLLRSLSRRTKGVYYFEAQLSDGKRSARVVSCSGVSSALSGLARRSLCLANLCSLCSGALDVHSFSCVVSA